MVGATYVSQSSNCHPWNHGQFVYVGQAHYNNCRATSNFNSVLGILSHLIFTKMIWSLEKPNVLPKRISKDKGQLPSKYASHLVLGQGTGSLMWTVLDPCETIELDTYTLLTLCCFSSKAGSVYRNSDELTRAKLKPGGTLEVLEHPLPLFTQ